MKTVIDRSVVRSAHGHKFRNRRVTFADEANTEINKGDELGEILRMHNAVPPKIDEDDDEDEVPIGPKQDQQSGDDNNIATRTRSKNRNSVSGILNTQALVSNPKTPRKILDLVRFLPFVLLFCTLQLSAVMTQETLFDPIPEGIQESIGSKENENFQKFILNLDDNLVQQQKYVQAMDRHADAIDPLDSRKSPFCDESLWDCTNIISHRIKGKKVEIKCMWKDPNKSTSWIDMYALAMQDPIPILKYAKDKHIVTQAPFNVLAQYCTGDSPSQLARVFKAKCRPGSAKYKFGVQVPMGVKQALYLDKVNGDNAWQGAIAKELAQLNDYKTFRTLLPGETLSSEYKKIPYHIVFDVKFDLRKKARLVAGGNFTSMAKEDIYSGVVGMETIRMGLFLGEHNGLSCCAGDIGNAFLYGKTKEKVYIIAGPEFGRELEGKILVIDKALYGLRTSSARFHEHLATQLIKLGFRPSKADFNLWMKDMGTHYEYVATFVDDVLIWSKDPMAIMEELKKTYILKGVGIPEYYLGGDVETLDEHWTIANVNMAFSAKTYIKNVIPKFESMFGETFKTVRTPMAEDYHPEMEDSPFLSNDDAARFRSVIGSLNWVITLGRFDVNYATSALSRFNMAPKEGHLTAVKRILGYLKVYAKGRIIFDTSYTDHSKHKVEDHPGWSQMYPDAQEELPPDMPAKRMKPVRITVYVDLDHGHDLVTRRSITGIILMLNGTPVRWLCKRQKTVETSTYGSELVAAKVATELIIETRYMLRMLGVPVDEPALMLGDNMSVVLNTTVPSSVLKKKHCSISYHRVREAIAGKIIRFAHIKSETNFADILTKPLSNQKFYALVKPLLFRSPPHLDNKKQN